MLEIRLNLPGRGSSSCSVPCGVLPLLYLLLLVSCMLVTTNGGSFGVFFKHDLNFPLLVCRTSTMITPARSRVPPIAKPIANVSAALPPPSSCVGSDDVVLSGGLVPTPAMVLMAFGEAVVLYHLVEVWGQTLLDGMSNMMVTLMMPVAKGVQHNTPTNSSLLLCYSKPLQVVQWQYSRLCTPGPDLTVKLGLVQW
eukprot:scpid36522/ scgid11239/ 